MSEQRMTKKKLLAPFIWHPIETVPEDVAVLVAYDNKSVDFIAADSNHGYKWRPYDGKRERGLLKPTHWMHVEAPR
jgi:hypothetical protein